MSNQNNPWGNNSGNNQTPPDLDQVIDELKQKVSGLFGGRKPSGNSNNSGGDNNFNNSDNASVIGDKFPSFNGKIKYIIAILLVIWLLFGFYIIEPAERGVVTRFGEFTTETREGIHWHLPYPIESVQIVDISQNRTREIGYREVLGANGQKFSRKIPAESLMLTKDGNIVDVGFKIQYNILNAKDYLFNVLDPERTLDQAANSAIREIIGKQNIDYILSENRSDISPFVKEKTQDLLDDYRVGLNIINVNFSSAQAPDQVQEAYSDVTKAKTDKERFINQAQAYANEILPQARGQAARIIEEANAYKSQIVAKSEGESFRFLQILQEYEKAPEVTKERLYREAMEEVFANTSKVVIGGDSNSMMYLPLDKLINNRTTTRDLVNTQQATEDGSNTQKSNPNLRNLLRNREVK